MRNATRNGPINSPNPFEDAEWREFLELQRAFYQDGVPPLALNFSPVQAPSAKQRLEARAHGALSFGMAGVRRMALCSDSAFARGAATAMGWHLRRGFEMRAFRSVGYTAAVSWLHEDSAFLQQEVVATLRALARDAGYVLAES